MHYSAYGFSKNGEPTIVPHVSNFKLLLQKFRLNFINSKSKDKTYLGVIGQREKLSEKDIIKLNVMYACSNNTVNDQWTFCNLRLGQFGTYLSAQLLCNRMVIRFIP